MDCTIWQLPNDEGSAIKMLQDYRIIHREGQCSNNHQMKLMFSSKEAPKWQCYLRSCREKERTRTQTWFDGLRLPILTAVRFIYMWCQELNSIDLCEMQLEMNHNTAVDWNNYLREVCANALLSRPNIEIGGSNKIVEIYKSLFTKNALPLQNAFFAGHALPKQRVFGGLYRETKMNVSTILDRSAKTLMTAIEENIADESDIVGARMRQMNCINSSI
ncbi:DDE_Tnp_IS1595 domain-containing protein [Caerostris extrusa]|uniref:DDE_Tnp_IS1595 domain-containing protein n=1 Tax=Caerostris extrusa TaxID=172846 RepID=A0AAV4Q7Z7_CAEEX|nr:DDE_Tnp_IS1595 domain-containing protein [Caerostris extrusa]